MPRPSSGEAPSVSGSWATDKDVAWMIATPAQFHKAHWEAKLRLGDAYEVVDARDVAVNIHWHNHGTSYIVDELIGGPWDA